MQAKLPTHTTVTLKAILLCKRHTSLALADGVIRFRAMHSNLRPEHAVPSVLAEVLALGI